MTTVIYRSDEDIAEADPRREGYVEIPRAKPSRDGWHWFADPITLCCRPLRSGTICQLENGHRGRCTSVTHGCDACDRILRGSQPWYVNDEIGVCFMCYRTNWQEAEWKKPPRPIPYPRHDADWHEIVPDPTETWCDECGTTLDRATLKMLRRRDELVEHWKRRVERRAEGWG